MRLTTCITLIALTSTFCSCYRKAYYVSPLYGRSTPYHSIPLKNEQVASALYANVSVQAGIANDNGADGTLSLQFNAYQTHQLGFLQAYYGGGLTLGLYHVADFDTAGYYNNIRYQPSYLNVLAINKYAGDHFFSSGNIHGGLNISIPFSNRPRAGEWRIGTKAALHKEIGTYLSFRKSLNPDSVSGVAASSLLGSISGCTELIFPSGRNGNFGGQFEAGWLLGKDYKDIYFGKRDWSSDASRYGFVTLTLQFTKNNGTAYFHQTIGNRLVSFQAGYNYRITATKKKPR